jgi:hypothetical protein
MLMFKMIIYSIITIATIHFVLYYFNIDYSNLLHIFKSKINKINESKLINIDSINDSINELKTLNECINNGQIDTCFS